uniref:Decapping nuclease n=1 Tax=Strongyloides stercoralis TaxID=6248 RepID=A0A0K0DX53_STRER
MSMSYSYSQPVKLFSFNVEKQEDGTNKYNFNENSFPIFYKHSGVITPPLNLVSGVDKYFDKPYSFNNLCLWDLMAYIHNAVGFSLHHITDHSDIVCYRGFLKELALLPLGESLNHTFIAFMYNGIVFIERIEKSTSLINNKTIEKEYMKKKLSKFCTTKSGIENSNHNSTANLDDNYYVTKTRVFQSENLKIKVMFTGGFDAINPYRLSEENNSMEIKVCPGHIAHLFKGSALYKTWAQSFIAGNEVLAAGIRKNTLVNNIKLLNVSDLESKLPFLPSKIMEFVGRSLESIVNACRKYPNKYIIIPQDKFSLSIIDEETTETINYSRPTSTFLQAFPKETH